MDQLSNELFAMVIGHLFEPSPTDSSAQHCRAGYASVCRTWQAHVEGHTMRSIRVKSSELDVFATIFQDPRRRALLKNVKYTIEMPKYVDGSRKHANWAALEQAAMDLFRLLSAWEQRQDVESIRPLHLGIDCEGPSELWNGPPDVPDDFDDDPDHFAAPLPVVHSIMALELCIWSRPSIACALAAAVPRLRSLDLELYGPIDYNFHLRRKDWAALAAGLLSALRKAPSPVRLVLQREIWEDESHDYNAAQVGPDELCGALRLLGVEGKLSELILKNVHVSKALFRTSPGETWPALRHFQVRTGVVSVRGHEGFMEAAAGAVLRMPALKSGCVEMSLQRCRLPGSLHGHTVVQWAERGVKVNWPKFAWMRRMRLPKPWGPSEKLVRRCRVWVCRPTSWIESNSVRQLWKEWVGDQGLVQLNLSREA